MKKLLTLVFTLAVACALSMPVFAQGTAGSSGQTKAGTAKTKKKGTHKKGGKKGKKDNAEGTTTPPK